MITAPQPSRQNLVATAILSPPALGPPSCCSFANTTRKIQLALLFSLLRTPCGHSDGHHLDRCRCHYHRQNQTQNQIQSATSCFRRCWPTMHPPDLATLIVSRSSNASRWYKPWKIKVKWWKVEHESLLYNRFWESRKIKHNIMKWCGKGLEGARCFIWWD